MMETPLTGAVSLLPSVEETPMCSQYSKDIGLDPRGTALNIDALLLVEVPLPWPKPVFDHPYLNGLEPLIQTSMGMTRVLASQPREGNKSVSATIFHKEETITRWDFPLDKENSLTQLVENLITSNPKSLDSKKSTQNKEAILLCTQGSHDICCGSKGTRLAELIEAHDNDIELFKVSHLGGHRFSPTAMTMPDGRMWAGLDLETIFSIIEKKIEVEKVAKLCRGWIGAAKGPEQIAEIEIFKQTGWKLDKQNREIITRASDNKWSIEIAVEDKKWLVCINKGREVPTITCRSEGGLPFTTANEYIVESVEKIT